MNFRRPFAAMLLASLLALPAPHASAQTLEPDRRPAGIEAGSGSASAPDWFEQLGDDGRSLLGAPLRWDSRTWKRVGLACGAVAILMAADGAARERLVTGPYRTPQNALDLVGPLGQEYSWAVLAGFYGAGRVTGNERAMAVAQDGLKASLIAAGIVTPAIQALAGRARPDTDGGGRTFLSGGSSFPSGHTTQAFALAGVIASHDARWWVDLVAYALASGVGWSRIANDAHFLSDVVAGALIGVSVGRAVVRMNDERRITIEPFVIEDGGGVVFRMDAGSLRGLFRRGRP